MSRRPKSTQKQPISRKHLHQQSLFEYTHRASSSSKASPKSLEDSQKSSSRNVQSIRHRKRKRPMRAQSDSQSESGASSNVEAIHFEPRPVISISSESDDNDILLSPRRPSQKTVATSSRKIITSAEASDDDEEPVVSRKKKVNAMSTRSVPSGSESESQARAKRRRLVKGDRPSTPESEIELDKSHILQSRLRARGKRSEYQKHLERLMRKKKGSTAASPSLEASSEDISNDELSTPFAGAKPGEAGEDGFGDNSEADSQADDDGFIVADDATAVAHLPAAFSMSAHQDLVHHFKIICQLFVHMAVKPTAERRAFMEHALKEDEYFSISLQMTRNKLSGLRDSVASSVWRPKLRISLQSFPDYELHHLDFAIPHCDACHLGGRMSTLMGALHGELYDKYSFEPLEMSDESSSDEEEERFQKEYNLGRFCAARTKAFHRLSHWEYHLYHAVLREINQLRGKGKFVPVAYYKGLLPPSDLTDADGIMDWLDQRGFVSMEWQKIKEMMGSVRKLEQHVGKEDDIGLDV